MEASETIVAKINNNNKKDSNFLFHFVVYPFHSPTVDCQTVSLARNFTRELEH